MVQQPHLEAMDPEHVNFDARTLSLLKRIAHDRRASGSSVGLSPQPPLRDELAVARERAGRARCSGRGERRAYGLPHRGLCCL